MNEQISRAQAQAKTIEFLRDEYRIAKKSDVTMGNLSVAFPQGFIPYFDDDGDLISISISPESPQHVCDLLKEVETSTAAFNALIAWSAAQLLVTRSIPNRDVERFLISYLVGVKKSPPNWGGITKRLRKITSMRFFVLQSLNSNVRASSQPETMTRTIKIALVTL
jgi:hypothetical protein